MVASEVHHACSNVLIRGREASVIVAWILRGQKDVVVLQQGGLRGNMGVGGRLWLLMSLGALALQAIPGGVVVRAELFASNRDRSDIEFLVIQWRGRRHVHRAIWGTHGQVPIHLDVVA